MLLSVNVGDVGRVLVARTFGVTHTRVSPMFPFLSSSYLRTYRHGDQVVIDQAAEGRRQLLTTLELDVLSAYWPPAADEAAWQRIVDQHGQTRAEQVVMDLAGRRVLVPDAATDEAVLDSALTEGLRPAPFVDQVELTNHCPMKCGFCPRGVEGAMTRPTGFMDRDVFAALLAQVPREQTTSWRAELHHLGESLLHPQVVELVGMAAERGLPVEMSVNPSHLRPDLARGLIDAGIGRLVLSLDGLDAETLAAARGPAARFDQAERNIEQLFSMIGAMRHPPEVIVQMLRLHRNRDQHEAFLERYGRTGLPTVHATIKDLEGPDPDLGRETCEPPSYLCVSPWRSVVVLWDGRVVPCCKDADAKLVLGDLRHQSLEQIWQGPAARALRAIHSAGVTIPGAHLCSCCPWGRAEFARGAPRRHPSKARREPYAW